MGQSFVDIVLARKPELEQDNPAPGTQIPNENSQPVFPTDVDQFNLAEWLDPEVPGPLLSPAIPHASELSAVDKLGAWDTD